MGRAGSALLNAALGVAAFLAMGAALRPLAPGPDGFAATPKLRYLAEHADEYDTVIVGSSRVFRHVSTNAFDARMAELGHPLRTFNLGAAGLGQLESDHLLREVLAIEGLDLRYVFLEPGRWTGRIPDENVETARTVAWHTPHGTRVGVATSFRERTDLADRVELAWMHVRLGAWWLANRGQGRRFVRERRGLLEPDELTLPELEAEHGFQPLDDLEGDEYERRRRKLLTNPGGFHERVAELSAVNPRQAGPGLADLDVIAEQHELVREAGAELVFLLPPGTIPTPASFFLHEAGIYRHLLSFNEPTIFPELYARKRFFDQNHLKREASLEFSERFAEAFVALLEGRRDVRGLIHPAAGPRLQALRGR